MADVDLSQYEEHLIHWTGEWPCDHRDPEVVGLFDKRTSELKAIVCQHCARVHFIT